MKAKEIEAIIAKEISTLGYDELLETEEQKIKKLGKKTQKFLRFLIGERKKL